MFNKKENTEDFSVALSELSSRIDRLELSAMGRTQSHPNITCVGIEKQVELILEFLNLEVAPMESLREITVKDYGLKRKQENNNGE